MLLFYFISYILAETSRAVLLYFSPLAAPLFSFLIVLTLSHQFCLEHASEFSVSPSFPTFPNTHLPPLF